MHFALARLEAVWPPSTVHPYSRSTEPLPRDTVSDWWQLEINLGTDRSRVSVNANVQWRQSTLSTAAGAADGGLQGWNPVGSASTPITPLC